MYRPILALFVCALIALPSLALAQDASGQCFAKDQVIAMEAKPGVHFRKVTGLEADALTAVLKANNAKFGTSYVVFWMDGKDYGKAKIVTFDEHNCADQAILGPRDQILKIIGGDGV
jgi:hypothetical protein